jgi:hypothetical protein
MGLQKESFFENEEKVSLHGGVQSVTGWAGDMMADKACPKSKREGEENT